MTRPPDSSQNASRPEDGLGSRGPAPAGAADAGDLPTSRPPAALLTLAIEASNPGPDPARADAREPNLGRASVALGLVARGAGVRLLGREALRSEHRHDDDLLPAIDRLFKAAGSSPRDIRRVAVSVGPGGFTGLRSAVAAAKMIAEATGSACVAVPTAIVAALGVPAPVREAAPLLVLLAWKRTDVWATRFEPGARPEQEAPGALMPLSAVAQALNETIIADEALERLLREQGHLQPSRVVRPPALDAANVLEASAWLAECDPLALAPLYPREPEAVTKWRELGKGLGGVKPAPGA